jgi:signal transduction histidine kinase
VIAVHADNLTRDDGPVDAPSFASAILNILDDSALETARLADTQRAILNILDDSALETARLADTQRAILNILEDVAGETARLEDTQRAVLNILEDSAQETAQLAETQRAMLNILEDVDVERKKVEQAKAAAEAVSADLSRQTQELARSNRDLEQFAYVASHDLQEPLRMVSSFTELLGRRYKGKLDAEADEFIGFAVDAAARMGSMINDLLAYARLGSGERQVGSVNCRSVLAQVLVNLEAVIEENRAQVTSDSLPTLTANETELTQLLQNLVSNAIKFRTERPPVVHVSAARVGAEWRFAVRDSGIGIAPEHMDRIFVIFQRLNPRDRYSGTGIGLAICKKIVERHGGRIWVESTCGGGSTFFFTIPEREDATR